MQLLYSALKDLEANYPEILKTLFFVNGKFAYFQNSIFSKIEAKVGDLKNQFITDLTEI